MLLVALLGLLAARLSILWATPLELGPDEAQYWFWSKTPAFGYFSKPPMIAWVIGLTSSLCGDAEPCVRMGAPLIHALTALGVYVLARTLYDPQIALWAGLTFALLPGVSLSSLLITTDVPLLLFWVWALVATVHLLERFSWSWAAVWGLAVGLGLLAKYAMAYVFAGVFLAALLTQTPWRQLLRLDWLLGVGIAFALLAPNVIWNIQNGFATVRHTASNANWQAETLFNIGKLLEFVGGQFALLGPIIAGLFVAGLVWGWYRRGPHSQLRADMVLLAFSLPVLIVVTTQAFISRANANWAAVALVPICVLVAAWAWRLGYQRWLLAGIGLNALLGAIVAVMAVSPAAVAALNRHNDVKRLRGWSELGTQIMVRADRGGFSAVLSDDREDMGSLLYYGRASRVEVRSFVPATGPNYEYHLSRPLAAMSDGRVLLVTRQGDVSAITARFARAEKLESLTVSLGGNKTRTVHLYALEAPFTPAWRP
ncbi:MAG TPA: 4-amino-4-deoxy-L-arabinose transferase [Alphaproteobacteria bacterium]|nr:4-amino-4-deoxy-L-arabinose transferase [Alphaproteobacteria bacterium]